MQRTMVMLPTAGIHVFMALYGLTVFLETPDAQKKGRKRYIAASFIITVLRALSASLDMANFFQTLFKSTSPSQWATLMSTEYYPNWKCYLGNTALGLVPMVGDTLLVRVAPYCLPTICLSSRIVPGVPLLHSVRGILVDNNSANDDDPILAKSVLCRLIHSRFVRLTLGSERQTIYI